MNENKIPVCSPEIGEKEVEYVTEYILSGWTSFVGEYAKARICEVDYCSATVEKDIVIQEGPEKHTIRFDFPEEIEQCLEENNSQLVTFCSFLELGGASSEKICNCNSNRTSYLTRNVGGGEQ